MLKNHSKASKRDDDVCNVIHRIYILENLYLDIEWILWIETILKLETDLSSCLLIFIVTSHTKFSE